MDGYTNTVRQIHAAVLQQAQQVIVAQNNLFHILQGARRDEFEDEREKERERETETERERETLLALL